MLILLQASVLDSGYLSSSLLTLSLTVKSIDDEPPRLTSSTTHSHVEEGGPTALLDSNATLHDVDNCPEHRLIREIRLVPTDFVDGDDILLDVMGSEIEFSVLKNGDFESGSGYGSGVSDLLEGGLSGYPSVTLTCNQTAHPDCYNSLLQGLLYNSTADEPALHDRHIDLEVSIAHNVFTSTYIHSILFGPHAGCG